MAEARFFVLSAKDSMKRRLKINGFIIFIVALLIVLFPAVVFRKASGSFFNGIMKIIGIAFILLGQIFRASARGYKSENSQEGLFLLRSGPYAVSRNPMYLGILLIGLGIVSVLFKWWVLSAFLLLFILRYLPLIFKEEKKLSVLFPQAYQDYQRSVPRILPSLSMIATREISEYLPIKLPWLKKEIGSILAVLFITLFLESWEDIKNAGIRAYLFKEGTGILVVIIFFIYLVGYLNRRTKNGVPNKG